MAHISVSNHFKRFLVLRGHTYRRASKKNKKNKKERIIYALVMLEIRAIMPKVRLNTAKNVRT